MPNKATKPRLHVNPDFADESMLLPSSFADSPAAEVELPMYPHTSVFRSEKLTVRVRSSAVKMASSSSSRRSGNSPLPIFGDHDTIGGTVTLQPPAHLAPGRLTISFEGSFSYISASAKLLQGSTSQQPSGRYEHIFYADSTTLIPSSDSGSPRTSKPSSPTSKKSERKSPSPNRKVSFPSLRSRDSPPAARAFSFNFAIPRKGRLGEELPPTLSSSTLLANGSRSRATGEFVEVSYKLLALWEPYDDTEGRDLLEVPVLFQPDSDFSSLDGMSIEPERWLEIPLRSDRPLPVQCAFTLPNPGDFPRFGAMPYYVVFTTKPKSSSLSREIAADSTITATLLRQVTIDSSQSQPSSSYTSSTPPTPPSSATEDSDSQGSSSLYIPSKKRLLKRMVRSAPPTLRQPSRTDSFAAGADPERNKPLPDLPIVMQDSRILHTEVSVGFPKRPRNPGDHRGHGSVEAQTSLPDGLFKGKMHFSSGMLPTIDWAGLSVRYYLDVSVLFGQDEMRSRIPIRLY